MSQVTVARRGAVAICTVANPPDGYMDRDTVPELERATTELERDPAVRAVVFAGGLAGVFIRHYSVDELAALSKDLRARGTRVDTNTPNPEREIDALFRRIVEMSKPCIAALNGTAMGGGFEFALCCDIRIAEDGPYWYGLPEVNVGLIPGAGGTQKLTALVGPARALELILRGRTVSPAEAMQLGLVHEVAPAGRSVARAISLAEELASNSALAVGHVKRLIRQVFGAPGTDGPGMERTLFLDALLSDEALRRMEQMNAGSRDIRNP